MELTLKIMLLAVGFSILIKGADWLVDGAVAVAKRLGMSPLIIGLTIVAMGTSAPEVAASIKAALSDSAGIAVGNVYGSNIANLALVGGLCAFIRPITVGRPALVRDVPIMMAVSLLLYGVFYNGQLGRIESSGMLLLFFAIIIFLIGSERKRSQKNSVAFSDQVHSVEHATHHHPKKIWTSVGLILLGLVCLTVGADLTVDSAKYLGFKIGLSEAVIGYTIVAIGTSLPELTTCLIAAIKGHDDLSVGNLVGSNIFNTLLVIGASGMVKPYAIEARLIGLDYWLMIGILALFSVIVIAFKKVSRPAGVFLFLCYCGYIVYCLLNTQEQVI
jgi:cation:H+ antiporter